MKDWKHAQKEQLINFLAVDFFDDVKDIGKVAKSKGAASAAFGQAKSKYLRRSLKYPAELRPGEAAKALIDTLKAVSEERRAAWFERRLKDLQNKDQAKH